MMTMGQKEILDFLARYPNTEFTKTQIEEALGECRGHLCPSLVQLRKNREVEYRKGSPPSSGGKGPYYYKYKNSEDFKIIVRKQENLEFQVTR
jgi:hypothetical protein